MPSAELEPHIGEVATASVACGVMGYGGNKGGVAISFSLFRRRLVVVSSHFAAHQVRCITQAGMHSISMHCACTCACACAYNQHTSTTLFALHTQPFCINNIAGQG